MNLSHFEKLDPLLLPGLLNTTLRNDCEDLHDLLRTHDIDEEKLTQTMAAIGYRYCKETRQFRSIPQTD